MVHRQFPYESKCFMKTSCSLCIVAGSSLSLFHLHFTPAGALWLKPRHRKGTGSVRRSGWLRRARLSLWAVARLADWCRLLTSVVHDRAGNPASDAQRLWCRTMTSDRNVQDHITGVSEEGRESQRRAGAHDRCGLDRNRPVRAPLRESTRVGRVHLRLPSARDTGRAADDAVRRHCRMEDVTAALRALVESNAAIDRSLTATGAAQKELRRSNRAVQKVLATRVLYDGGQ